MNPTRLDRLLIALILLTCNGLRANDEMPQRIMFLGDSLTAGYGIDQRDAYPALIQSRIEAAGLPHEVIASGLSGETSAGGLRRANWVLQRPVDILVLALGANDGLRGTSLSDTRSNLQGIIDIARSKNPEVEIVIAGMQMPPNLGAAYTAEFRSLFPELAEENEATLIPFLLEGVAGDPKLNLGDGIHPNEAGHKVLAENVWSSIEPLLAR